jgi:hypothetical protein
MGAYSQLIKATELSEYVDLVPGVEVSRSISDGALTDFGGGERRPRIAAPPARASST